jgi:hypothetical protein
MNVHPGYWREQILYDVVSVIFVMWEVFQFRLWTIPKYAKKVKILQKVMVTGNFVQNLIVIALNVDVRSVWGIYNPTIVLCAALFIIQIPVYAVALWLREVSKINARSPEVADRQKAEISFRAVVIFCGAFFCGTVILLALTLVFDKLAIMSSGIFALFLLCVMTQFSGNRFIKVVKATLLNTSLTSSSASLGNQTNNQKTPAQARRMKVKLFIVSFLLLLTFTIGIYLLANYNAPVSFLKPTNPEVYEFNPLIFLMELLAAVMSLSQLTTGSVLNAEEDDDQSIMAVQAGHSKTEGSKH